MMTLNRFTATRDLLLLTVFRKGDGWGLRVEEIDDPDGAYAPDTTYPNDGIAKSKATMAVQELFGYGYAEGDFNWEPTGATHL